MKIEKESGTDVLIRAMEEFGSSEASDVVVVFVDSDRMLHVMANTLNAHTVGLLESAKMMVLKAMIGPSNG
jgi:hypothetical protein